MLEKGDVAFSATFRLGSLRVREILEGEQGSLARERRAIERQIERTIQQVRDSVPLSGKPGIILLGGDVRFAADCLHPDWDRASSIRLSVAGLRRFTENVLPMSADELVGFAAL